MKNYAYRFDITGDPLYQQHAEIRAAYALAKRAHEGQSRGKIDPAIPYLTHPVMAYDLMIGMGVTDPEILAATLLHDTLEDYPEYTAQPLQLQKDLRAALKEEWPQPEDTLRVSGAASNIAAMVLQVTNVPVPMENKGISQMRRAESISQPARLIKIADQTTNLICNLMMENHAGFSHHKATLFAQKARDLVVAITANEYVTASERAELSRWKKLFRNVYTWNAELLAAKTPKTRLRVRERFADQMEHIVPALGETDVATPYHEVEYSVHFSKRHPAAHEESRQEIGLFGQPEYAGLTRVDLNDEGDVVGFQTWAAPEAGSKHYRNQMQDVLVGYLRNSGHDVIIDPQLQPVEVQHERHLEGRHHRLDKPMAAHQFSLLCTHADAIQPHTDMLRLLRKARDIKLDYVMPEPGGPGR